MRRGIHLLVNVHYSAIKANEERPPRRKRLILVNNAIRQCHGLSWITQQRVVDAERLRKRLIRLWCIDADRKVRDVEAPDVLATLTE